MKALLFGGLEKLEQEIVRQDSVVSVQRMYVSIEQCISKHIQAFLMLHVAHAKRCSHLIALKYTTKNMKIEDF